MNTDNWNEMCGHECNVGGKYVLPQAEAFGLAWSIAIRSSHPVPCETSEVAALERPNPGAPPLSLPTYSSKQ